MSAAMVMRLVRNVVLLSVPGIVLGLAGVEGALRLVRYAPYYLDARAFMPSRNPDLIYELRPGFRGLYAGVPISVDARGVRGTERTSGPGAGYRIAVVGDSIAFGQGLPDGQTLADHLEVLLRERRREPVEAMNWGVPGYDTCQEAAQFEERVVAYRPSVAVLVYVENDTDPPVFRVEAGRVVSPDVKTGGFGDLMAELRKRSAVYNFVWTRWQVVKLRPLPEGEYQRVLARKFDESTPAWRRSRECLWRMIDAAGAQSVRVIVVPFPVLRGLARTPYPFQGYIDAVCGAARSRGVECLDVVPVLRESGVRLTISSIEPHPSSGVMAEIAGRVGSLLGR